MIKPKMTLVALAGALLLCSVAVGQSLTPVPAVPVAPALPKPGAVVGSIADSLFLNGAVAAMRERKAIRAARNYQFKLRAFVVGLTPDQYKAVVADPVQSAALWNGLAYVQTMRSFYARPSRVHAPSTDSEDAPVVTTGEGHTVYSASECIGPIIMGECKGSILPNTAYHPTCHGEMLNGMCTGPMF